jgi:hypothetical protein
MGPGYGGLDVKPLPVAAGDTILSAEEQSGMRSIKHVQLYYRFTEQEVENRCINI